MLWCMLSVSARTKYCQSTLHTWGRRTREGDAPTCAYVTTSYRSDFTFNISSTNSNTATLMSTCSAYTLHIPNLYILQRLPFPGSLKASLWGTGCRGSRIRKPEVRSRRKSKKVGSRKSESRNRKWTVGSWKSEVGSLPRGCHCSCTLFFA